MVSMVPIGSARWHVVNLMKWYSVYMEQKGGLEWQQIRPDEVIFHKYGEATQVLTRGGSYFSDEEKTSFPSPVRTSGRILRCGS